MSLHPVPQGVPTDDLVVNANVGSTFTIDCRQATVWDLTLTAACTITLTGASATRASELTLIIRQDATGGRTITWPTVTWLSGAAPTLHSAASAVDVVTLVSDDGGSTWIGAQAVAPYPTGYEINYTQLATPLNIVSTTESAGTSVLAPGALTFDGAPVLCEFFAKLRAPSVAGQSIVISLFEGSTQITELAMITNPAAATMNAPALAGYRFTPSAGSHTYTITGFVTNTTGTPGVRAGAGGTSGDPPAYVRFTKV